MSAIRFPNWVCAMAARVALFALGSIVSAQAAEYPARPVRLVVPFATGGSTDILARIIATGLSEKLGKSIVVENRLGAGGLVASEIVARAAPDGYTLLMISSSFSVNPVIHKTLPFDPIKDFSPVVLAAATPLVIASTLELPANSVSELIAYAKSNPDKLSYGSTGTGSVANLAGELFKRTAGINITFIPYGGAGQVFVDVISGRIQLAFVSVASALPHLQSKRMKAIAVTSAQRIKSLPEVPTVREAAFRDYEVESWQGIIAPVGVPPAILNRLHREVSSAVRTPEAERLLIAQAFDLRDVTRDEFGRIIANDIKKWMALYRK